jgi:hypothetical protein
MYRSLERDAESSVEHLGKIGLAPSGVMVVKNTSQQIGSLRDAVHDVADMAHMLTVTATIEASGNASYNSEKLEVLHDARKLSQALTERLASLNDLEPKTAPATAHAQMVSALGSAFSALGGTLLEPSKPLDSFQAIYERARSVGFSYEGVDEHRKLVFRRTAEETLSHDDSVEAGRQLLHAITTNTAPGDAGADHAVANLLRSAAGFRLITTSS